MDKTKKETLKEIQELQQENKSLKLALESEITRRQDLLLKSEEKYRSLVENALVGVYEISLDGSIIYANDALKMIMELDCDDSTSLNVIPFYKEPRDREGLIDELKVKGEVRNFETELISCKGNPREVIINVRLDGGVLKGMLLDITDRKRLEQLIRKEKEHLDSMLTSSTAMIYSCEAFGDFDAKYVSENISNITGYSCEDFLSKGFWVSNIHPDDAPVIFNNIGKLFENNYHQHEYRFRFKDGSYHWMQGELKLVRDEQGDPKEIRGTWSEINSRKLTEENLRTSLSLNEATLQSIHNGILVVDKQGLIVKTNNKFAELWQIPADVINSGDDQTLLNHVIGQLEDPDEFLFKVSELYKTPESESFDLIYFKDRRIFDRISKPMYLDGQPKGRVWSFLDITDRKRADERYRLLADHMNDIVWLMDMDLNVIYQSPSSERMRGFTLQEFQELPLEKNLAPESLKMAYDIFQKELPKVFAQPDYNPVYSLEIEYYRKDGSTFWSDTKFSFIRNDKGIPVSIIGEGRDITERKQADEALRKSQLSLEEAQMTANIGSWEYDIATDRPSWSKQMFVLFGRNPSLGEPSWQEHRASIHPDDWEALDATVASGTAYSIIFRLLHPTLGTRWVWTINQPVTDKTGKVVKLKGTVQDITERKQAEDTLIEKEASLRIAQKIAKMGSWDLDIQTRNIKWSENVFHFYGFNPSEVEPSFELFLSTIHPEDVTYFNEIFAKIISEKKPVSFEYRVFLKDSSIRWIQNDVVPIMHGENLVRLQGAFFDITERKRAEEEIHKLNAELEQRVAERTEQLNINNKQLDSHIKEIEQLTYITTHDLQEPVRTMTSFSELLKQEYSDKLDEDGNKYVDFIFSSATRMGSLVKGLMGYSLLGQKKIISLVDCNKLLQEVISDLSESIHLSGAKITVQELPVLNGMSLELRLLFQNLLQNAIKFQRKDVPPEITVSAEKMKHEWVFTLEDNGIGVEERFKERIFIIFQRVHHLGKYDGNGIGLAYCKKIVEMHGGRIWVESTPGIGSIFKFTIPIYLSLRQL